MKDSSNDFRLRNSLKEIVAGFGLKHQFEQGMFSCPLTGECLNWDNLGRMKFDGEKLTLFSVNARIKNRLRVVPSGSMSAFRTSPVPAAATVHR